MDRRPVLGLRVHRDAWREWRDDPSHRAQAARRREIRRCSRVALRLSTPAPLFVLPRGRRGAFVCVREVFALISQKITLQPTFYHQVTLYVNASGRGNGFSFYDK